MAPEDEMDDIETLRRGKMATLKAAREAHRRWMANPPRESGTLFNEHVEMLRAAVKEADLDLKRFNEENPRQ